MYRDLLHVHRHNAMRYRLRTVGQQTSPAEQDQQCLLHVGVLQQRACSSLGQCCTLKAGSHPGCKSARVLPLRP